MPAKRIQKKIPLQYHTKKGTLFQYSAENSPRGIGVDGAFSGKGTDMHGIQRDRPDAKFIGKEANRPHAYDLTWTIRNPGKHGTLPTSHSLKKHTMKRS